MFALNCSPVSTNSNALVCPQQLFSFRLFSFRFGTVVHSFAAHMHEGAWKSPAVGERALVEDAPRRYDIVAAEDCVLNR